MLVKVIATGRDWADKRDEVAKPLSVAGVPCIVREYDAWDGPTASGECGQFLRYSDITPASPIRDDRFQEKGR